MMKFIKFKHIFGLSIAGALVVVGLLGYFAFQIHEDLSTIVDYKPKLTTKIYDRNNELVANVFDEENREFVPYDEIPPRLIEALIAIEDTAFFEHDGVNFEAIFRAVIKDLQTMSLAEGASTLTQQLVKNMVLTRDKKFTRKLKEVILSYRLEELLTKEEILERYLNQIYFGHQYHGIKTAALGYFKKDLKDLTLKEIAILVGLPKAPSAYDPTKHIDLSLSRANNVLARMRNLGWITPKEYALSSQEIPVVYDETLTQNRAPYLVDEALKEAGKYFEDIKTGGYTIKLSADIKVQDMAREALRYGYNEILKRDQEANLETLNGAIVVMNPLNGDILALVGGVDYAKSNFNRATQSLRQPGSSFKPFIYQIALNSGENPSSEVKDMPLIFEADADSEEEGQKDWKPRNFSGDFMGFITLREALMRSRNLATINLLNDMGIAKTLEELQNLGFSNIPRDLSIALGSFGISIVDFSKQYSMFAGFGTISNPILVKSITEANGTKMEFKNQRKKIQEPQQAYLMIDMLKSVVEDGTGKRAKIEGIEIAGKTGTSNDSIDVWFCGFAPEIQAIVWYGNDNNTPMKRTESGSVTAAPAFHMFMSRYLREFPNMRKTFQKPSGVLHGVYKGNDEIYTRTSPLPKPKENAAQTQEEDGLIF